MSRRIAVYPGSFDPLHNGHLDIVERCLPIFDEVLVAVLRNEEKKPRFSVEERLEMLHEVLAPMGRCRVESFSGLLVDFMDRVGAITIVRGLRALSDFDYEFQMALMNRRLDDQIDTVFLMPSERFIYLNSTLVREIAKLGGPIEGFVPPGVAQRLRERFHATSPR